MEALFLGEEKQPFPIHAFACVYFIFMDQVICGSRADLAAAARALYQSLRTFDEVS
jgi:hypothetical protein